MESNINSFDDIFKSLLILDENFLETELYKNAKDFILKSIDLNDKSDVKYLKQAAEVAQTLLRDTGGDLKSTVAGILYTTLINKSLGILPLVESVGKEIAGIVIGAEKIQNLKIGKIGQDADNYIKLALTYSEDVRSVLIILAGLIITLRKINDLKSESQELIINHIAQLYAPMAHRLGLYKIKTELEEAVMRYEAPEMYEFISKELKSSQAAREKYIENFIKPLKQKLDDAGFKYKVKGRTKAVSSIWKKIQYQGVGFQKVKDIFAIRIVLDSLPEREKTDCWNVYSIVTDMYRPDARRMRDWISVPRKSGYESLHATILGPGERWVEVQIRTERMDEIAEKGPAAHWRYKEKGKAGNASDWLAHMRDALENPDLFSADEEFHKKTQADEIFIFTPAGDLKKLPKGYSVLDFAFSIHSNVGEKCTGAMVDNVFKPLSYTLQNGQTVKINTSKQQTPNDEWLNIAQSPRARQKIKRFLKLSHYHRADAGKEIFKKKMEQLEIEFNEANIRKISDVFGAKHPLEMYHWFGESKLSVTKIKPAFEAAHVEPELEEEEEILPEEFETEVQANSDFLLLDNDLSTLDYHFAKCCNPVPGDKVFGFVTVSKGTKIHKANCSNATDLHKRYPYRILKARWNLKEGSNQSFVAEFLITGEDRSGIAGDISNTINVEAGLKLRSLSLNSLKNNLFSGKIGVEIKTAEDAQRIPEILKAKSYLHSVKRS